VPSFLDIRHSIHPYRAKQSASSSSTFSSSTPAPPSRRQSGATTATAATTEEGEWEEDSPPREGRRSSTRGSIPPVPAYLKCKDVSPSFDRLAYIKNSRMTARENERKAFIFRKVREGGRERGRKIGRVGWGKFLVL